MRPVSQSSAVTTSSVVSFEHFLSETIPDSELDLILSRLGVAQQCMDIVVCQLLFEKDGEWEIQAQGALMLLKDHKRKSYFLILSSSSGEVLWTQEIYHRCNFSPVGPFIQFSGDECQVGLNFSDEEEAIRFGNKMVKRSHAKRRTKKRKSRSRSKRFNETVPEIDENTERTITLGETKTPEKPEMQEPETVIDEDDSVKQETSVVALYEAQKGVAVFKEQGEKKKKRRGFFRGRSKSKSKSKRKHRGRLKLDISAPTDMRRTAGLAMNPNTGRMELSCEDEKMAQILINMGIVGDDHEAMTLLKNKRKRSRIDSAIEESGGIEKVLMATQQLPQTPPILEEEKGRLVISGPVAGSVTKNGRAFKYEQPIDIQKKKAVKSKSPGLIKKVFTRQKSKTRAPAPPKCTVPPPPPPPAPSAAPPPPAIPAAQNKPGPTEEKPTLLRELESSQLNLIQMIQEGPQLRHVSVTDRAPPPLSPRSKVMKNLLENPKSNLKHVPTPPPKQAPVFGDYFLSSLEKQLQEIKRMTHSDSENENENEPDDAWDEEIFF